MSYLTLPMLQDDGRARIDCPRKGVMAIGRCREFQRETAAAGKSCTCSVYEAYRAGEGDAELPLPPSETLCGRELTPELGQELDELRGHKKTGGTRRRAQLVAGAQSLDEQIAELQQTNHKSPRAVERVEEEADMTKLAKRCDKCGKASPGDTKIWGGLCKPCRDIRDEAKNKEAAAAIEQIAAKHAPAPAPAAGGSGGGVDIVAMTIVAPVPPKERQQLMQPVVQADLDRLTREINRLTRALNRANWLLQGVREGHIPIERLAEIEQARAAVEKARS
jgi:hypothetical protein